MAYKKYQKKSAEEKSEEIEEMQQQALAEIERYCEKPEDLQKLLDFQAQFYNYSIRNCALIQKQFDGANAVGSYNSFQAKGLNIKRGESGIRILGYRQDEYFSREDGKKVNLKYATKEDKAKIKAGTYEVKKKSVFYPTYVFDISQTDAKAEDIPKLYPNRWLEGDVKDYDKIMDALKQYGEMIGSKVIEAEMEIGAAKGLAFTESKEIVLNKRNSELQNVKTLVHELTHATLHSGKDRKKYEQHERELQAEMSAYVVCKHMGLDTEEYSIKYMHDWIADKEVNDKITLLNEVNKTAQNIIDVVEKELEKSRAEEKAMEEEQTIEQGAAQDAPEENKSKKIAVAFSDLQKDAQLVGVIREKLDYVDPEEVGKKEGVTYGYATFENPIILENVKEHEIEGALQEIYEGKTGNMLREAMEHDKVDGVLVKNNGKFMSMINIEGKKISKEEFAELTKNEGNAQEAKGKNTQEKVDPEKEAEKVENNLSERTEKEPAGEEGREAQPIQTKTREFSHLQLTKADDEMADLVLLCAQVAGVPLATAAELGVLTTLKETDRAKGLIRNTIEGFKERRFEKEVEKSADIKMPDAKSDKKLTNKEIALVFLASELTKYPEEVRDNKEFRDVLGKEKALETNLFMLQEKASNPDIGKEELDALSDQMSGIKEDLDNAIKEKNEILKNNVKEVQVQDPEKKSLGVILVENELMKMGKENRNAATLQAAARAKATNVVIDTQELRIPNREKKNTQVQAVDCVKINKVVTANNLNVYQHKNNPEKCFIGQAVGDGKIRKLSKDSSMEESLKSFKGLMQEQKAAGVVKEKTKERDQERERAV